MEDKEFQQRLHLREEFVDSGFINVLQWKNFQDYFNIEIERAKEEERKHIASEMKREGFDHAMIKKLTGLSEEEIDNL